MDPQAPIPGEPSPMKNFVGGGGCGCGCLGALIAALGAVALLGIPLAFYEGETTMILIGGGGAVAVGLLIGLLGAAVWGGSLFLE